MARIERSTNEKNINNRWGAHWRPSSTQLGIGLAGLGVLGLGAMNLYDQYKHAQNTAAAIEKTKNVFGQLSKYNMVPSPPILQMMELNKV